MSEPATIAEVLRDRGRVAALRSVLLLRFGALEPDDERRLQTATSEDVDRFLQRAMTADSIAEVLGE